MSKRTYTSYKNRKRLEVEDDLVIVFKDDSYDVYKNKDEEQLGTVLEYFVGTFFRRATALPGSDEIELHIEHPEFKKTIDSADYYGIVEIVYFIGCGIVCAAGMFFNAKPRSSLFCISDGKIKSVASNV